MDQKLKISLLAIARDFSSVLAGFKLAIIILGYFGVGSLAKWIIEQWYPFTRWVWDNVLLYFHIPEISDIEKDALTAIVFFFPLGVTALVYRFRKLDDGTTPRQRLISASLGILFVYIMCRNVIDFVFANAKMSKGLETLLSGADDLILVITLAVFVQVVLFFLFHFNLFDKLSGSIKISDNTRRIFIKLSQIIISIGTFMEKIISKANKPALGGVVAFYAIVGMLTSISLDNYLPLATIAYVGFVVIAAVTYAPKKLMLAAGASIALIFAAYGYEGLVAAVEFIENSPS